MHFVARKNRGQNGDILSNIAKAQSALPRLVKISAKIAATAYCPRKFPNRHWQILDLGED